MCVKTRAADALCGKLTIEIDGGSHRLRRGFYSRYPTLRREREGSDPFPEEGSRTGGDSRPRDRGIWHSLPRQLTAPSESNPLARWHEGSARRRGDLRDLGRGRVRGCESGRRREAGTRGCSRWQLPKTRRVAPTIGWVLLAAAMRQGST